MEKEAGPVTLAPLLVRVCRAAYLQRTGVQGYRKEGRGSVSICRLCTLLLVVVVYKRVPY